uniref:Uncharacterized protein n=1 Tax=Oryza barthii TaxID=65489 RepID=A0A0D3EP12_9ORYZ
MSGVVQSSPKHYNACLIKIRLFALIMQRIISFILYCSNDTSVIFLLSQVLIKFGSASLLNPADPTLQQRLTNRRPSLLGQHSQLPSAHFTDKETRRVIGRICYFFVGSATSCNQQTYKWLRLLGAPHHQVQNQVCTLNLYVDFHQLNLATN